MKLRLQASPLLLFLLPSLTAAAGLAADATYSSEIVSSSKIAIARDAKAPIVPAASPTGLVPEFAGQKPTSKAELGTKDAPVDGKDGKPHAGPFVDTSERKKQKPVPGEASELVAEEKLPPLKNAPADITVHDGKKIPEVNDGVMNDPARQLPKSGTTGTEGGVSEKDKATKAQEGQTGERVEKKPESPKEAPPLPHSEQEAIKGHDSKSGKGKSKDESGDDDFELAGLEKPKDLPDKKQDSPLPIPDSAHKGHLDVAQPDKFKIPDLDEEEEGLIQPFHSYILSLTMILVSEVGDKTFLIAALMAMKHDRILVFSAALSALMTMTVLSAILGHAVPTLLPQRFTNFMAAVLFLFFGVKMLREGLAMSPSEGVAAEMQEVEMELEEKEHLARQMGRRRSSVSPYALEMGLGRSHSSRKSRSGSRLPSPPRSPSSSRDNSPVRNSTLKSALAGFHNLVSLLLSPAWVQTFVMTFLGEWGDRSQIATIAMAAGQDYWWVTGGAISGHAVCTSVAVLGGRAIAGRVSLRFVTLSGATAFIIFGIIYFLEAMTSA